jgi:hypothetical protein
MRVRQGNEVAIRRAVHHGAGLEKSSENSRNQRANAAGTRVVVIPFAESSCAKVQRRTATGGGRQRECLTVNGSSTSDG